MSHSRKCSDYICQICIKENLPIGVVASSDTNMCKKPVNIILNPGYLPMSGCGLCTECGSDCTSCDLCLDLQRVCETCLSCLNYNIVDYNNLLRSLNNEKELLVVHFNASSLTSNLPKLENLLMNSQVKPDIIAISETRLKDTNEHLVTLPNYDFICKHSVTGNANFGGVGLYISEEIKYLRRTDLIFNFEGCETDFIEVFGSTRNNKKQNTMSYLWRYEHQHRCCWTKKYTRNSP